jgi:sterol desaturase/sphingolipid hydroxylase (fatty acid hydroxylase superfamily)
MEALSIALGALTWTLLEYLIHRHAGHGRFKRSPFGVEHIRHHIEGNYFAPTWKKVLFALGVTIVLGAIALAAAGTLGAIYVGGLIGCYALYEVLHRREHTHAGIGAYGRWARRHHFHHHFVDGRTNHGVTSPLWDLVFGTYRTPTTIKVPRKLCMQWLLDPATGDVRREHAHVYALKH